MALRDFLPQLDNTTRHVILRTLLWIGLIAGVVYTLGQSDVEFNTAPLAVKIEAPEKIIFPKSNIVVNLPVTVQLKNNMSEVAYLEAPNPCKIIRWYITTKEGEFVQAPAEEICSAAVMHANLPPERISQDEFEIPLETERYQEGKSYMLVLRYWGQDGGHAFEVGLE